MKKISFQTGGQLVYLDDFKRMFDTPMDALQGIGKYIGSTNKVIMGCTYTSSGSSPWTYTFEEGYIYTPSKGLVWCPANTFTTGSAPASIEGVLHIYYKSEINPDGAREFVDSTTHQTWTDNKCKIVPTDQADGWEDLGVYTSFQKSLPDTYYNKNQADTIFQPKSAMSNFYTRSEADTAVSNYVAATNYTKAETDYYFMKKVDMINYYNRADVNGTFQFKTDMAPYALKTDFGNYYPKSTTDTLIANAINNATLLTSADPIYDKLPSITIYGYQLRKYGNVVNFSFHFTKATADANKTYVQMCMIPAGYRPAERAIQAPLGNPAGSITESGTCVINTSGSVMISVGKGGQEWYGNITWIM